MAQTAVDAAKSTLVLNALLPVGTGGIPGTQLTALPATAMKLKLDLDRLDRLGVRHGDHRHGLHLRRDRLDHRLHAELVRVVGDPAVGHVPVLLDERLRERLDHRVAGAHGRVRRPGLVRQLGRPADRRGQRQHVRRGG